jgi:nicotinamide riboside kinase
VKVAFIGSHGTGKTTLTFQLAAHLKKLDRTVELVKEVARRSPTPLNRETTLDGQRWILHTQIADEIAAAIGHEAVVCDRSVIDNYAYLVHRFGRRPALDALVGEWLGTYTLLVRVPIVVAPRFDGVRDTSTSFQREIDAILDELLAAFGTSALALSASQPDGWLSEILGALELPETPPQLGLFDAS